MLPTVHQDLGRTGMAEEPVRARRPSVRTRLEHSEQIADLGLGAARLSDERWLDKLVEEPLLLRMPLVRQQQRLTLGDAESTWREWTGR